MKTKTRVRGGMVTYNHNETLVRDRATAKGLKVKSSIKAGLGGTNDPGPRR